MRRAIPPLAVALLFAAAGVAPLSASLGGDQTSVQSDRARMLGAMRQIVQRESFALHEWQSGNGIVVREFLSPSGIVFGVAWQGPVHPDMRQLLGPHFERYQQEAARLLRSRRGHGPLTVDLGDLFVQSSGHARAFSGRAILTRMLPQGVGTDVVR